MGQAIGSYAAQLMTPGNTGLRVGDRSPAGIHKAAVEFESVLLGQWLESAQKSFAEVPGGESEDADQGGEQMMGFAVQQLAGSLAKHGGLGLAKLVEKGLAKAAGQSVGTDVTGLAGRNRGE